MYGYIYKITNKINNKIYVGQHSKEIFDESYYGSGKYIKAAINKYGKENFHQEILEWCNSLEELNEKEIYWISKLDSTNKQIGYNICEGGNNYRTMCGENNPFYGRHHTEESKEINRQKHLKPRDPELMKKLHESNIGKHRTPEQKLNQSLAQKGQANHGTEIVKIKKFYYLEYKNNGGPLMWNDFQKQFKVTKEIENDFNRRNKTSD